MKPFAALMARSGIVTGMADLLRVHRVRRRSRRPPRRRRTRRRDLPLAIIGSLIVATVIYILVSARGGVDRRTRRSHGSEAPPADVAGRKGAGISWAATACRVRGADRDHLERDDRALRAEAHLLRDVARRAGPAQARVGQPEDAHAGLHGGRHRASDRAARWLVRFVEIVKLVNIGTLFAFFLVNVGVTTAAHPSGHGTAVPRRRSVRICRSSACALIIYLSVDQAARARPGRGSPAG